MDWFFPALVAAFSSATVSFFSKKAMKSVSYYVVSWALLALSLPFFLVCLFFVDIPVLGQWFWPAILSHVALFLVSIVIYMKALDASDLSLVLPILAFTPLFMLFSGPIINGEFPDAQSLLGIAAIVGGAYILSSNKKQRGILAPLRSLLHDRGPSLMLLVSFMWALMASTSKLAVSESSPVFALVATYALTALISTPALIFTGHLNRRVVSKNFKSLALIGFLTFLGNICLYYAFTLTMAVNAIAVKRFSILIGSFYGFAFFKEKNMVQRLAGSVLMITGAIVMLLSTAT